MPDSPPFSRVAEDHKSREGSLAYLDQALWRQLAEAKSDEDYCQSWLGLQSRMIGGVLLGLVALARLIKGLLPR